MRTWKCFATFSTKEKEGEEEKKKKIEELS
jgi:hypothetical protein